jgi:hypothetical protein
VFEWHKGFKVGRESLQDDEREGRPSTSRRDESTEVIQKCLPEDRTLSVRMLGGMRGISREIVLKILVEDLKKKIMSTHFVPRLLTPDQKHQCAASSVEFVEMIVDDRNVLKRIVTGDEIRRFMYDPETKSQSATWVSPKTPKAQEVKIAGENKVDCIFLC